MKKWYRVLLMVVTMAGLITCWTQAKAGSCTASTDGNHHYMQVLQRHEGTCETPAWGIDRCACGATQKLIYGTRGHDYDVEEKRVEATCTQDGYIIYSCYYGRYDWYVCEHPTKKTVIKAKGHQWQTVKTIREATCLQTGKVQSKCKTCGTTTERETEKAAHSYGAWQVTTAATDSAKGVETRTCSVCDGTDRREFYPKGTIYRGSDASKDEVKVVQQMLKDCGYLNDKVDGVFGKNSEKAVKAFQESAGLTADGIAWPQTVALLTEQWNVKRGITPVPTATPVPTDTPEPTVTPTPEPTITPTPEPTITPNPEPTITPTPEPTVIPTIEPTATPKPGADARIVSPIKPDELIEHDRHIRWLNLKKWGYGMFNDRGDMVLKSITEVGKGNSIKNLQ